MSKTNQVSLKEKDFLTWKHDDGTETRYIKVSAFKQILEGMPCEKKDIEYMEFDTGIGIQICEYDGQDFELGYNALCKKIEQYRDKCLKELKWK